MYWNVRDRDPNEKIRPECRSTPTRKQIKQQNKSNDKKSASPTHFIGSDLKGSPAFEYHGRRGVSLFRSFLLCGCLLWVVVVVVGGGGAGGGGGCGRFVIRG